MYQYCDCKIHTIIMYNKIIFLPKIGISLREEVLAFVKLWYDAENTITLKTSGSTGPPKIVQLEKKHMKASALATGRFFAFNENQSLLLNLPVGFVAGMMQVVRAIVHNMTLVVGPVSSNPLIQSLPFPIDFAAFVPYQVSTILAKPASRKEFEKIKTVIIGGAAVPKSLANTIASLKNSCYATFGMSETISHVALKKILKEKTNFNALPGVKFSTNAESCLVISAQHLEIDGMETNDIVALIDAYTFDWKGRKDFVINSGGIKIHPEVIEDKIHGILNENRFYITKSYHEELGEQVVLKIESMHVMDLTEIKANLKKVLSKYEMPKIIDLVFQFYETPTGKIIRE